MQGPLDNKQSATAEIQRHQPLLQQQQQLNRTMPKLALISDTCTSSGSKNTILRAERVSCPSPYPLSRSNQEMLTQQQQQAPNDHPNQHHQIMRIIEALNKIVERQSSLQELLIDIHKTTTALSGAIQNLTAKLDAVIPIGHDCSMQEDDGYNLNDHSQDAATAVNTSYDADAALDGLFVRMEQRVVGGGASQSAFNETPLSDTHPRLNNESKAAATTSATINQFDPRLHICPICAKAFTNGTSLKKHRAVLHTSSSDKTFRCKYSGCGRSYTLSSSLSRHVNNTH